MARTFDYTEAFSRNIGWVTETEQALLRGKRVAIAGMGGVGGAHLLTLARLGIGAFYIADLDTFELANFNRQAGAMVSTLGQPKVEALARQARDINPELDLQLFPQGVSAANVDAFLNDVDLFVDGLDFFVPEVRSLVFARCYEKGIPAITAGPIGMGAPYLIFLPGRMSFEEYFQLEGLPVERQYVNFLLGLTPKAWHRAYLVDPNRLDLANRRGPSTTMACQLCTGIVGIEALKILLHRQPVYAAPWYHLFDAYRGGYVRGQLRWGNRGPLQTLKRQLAYRMVEQRLAREATQPLREPEFVPRTEVEQILDLARWAPSGDNTQPWRFEIRSDRQVVVHGFDTRDHVIYDLQGHASQLALGGLLETLTMAASQFQLRCEVRRRPDLPETRPTFEIEFHAAPDLQTDPLTPFIRARVTNRRPFGRQPLSLRQRAALEEAVAPTYRVIWFESAQDKRRWAKLLFDNAHIRLTTPEAYPVHRDIIEWDAQFSQDRLPDQAVGLDPVALKLMRWAMASWERVRFLNTWLGGTLLPRLQLDVLPALGCAAHFVIVADRPLETLEDYVAGGRAMQRFWLTAAKLGLQFQPEMTPLILASYVRRGIEFTRTPRSLVNARRLTGQLESLLGPAVLDGAVYMGRVGFGPAPTARSLRLPLDQLIAGQTDQGATN